MDKKKIFKELKAWLIAIGVSFVVFVAIFIMLTWNEPIARSVYDNNPVTNTVTQVQSTLRNEPPFDSSNLSTKYLVGFIYDTADFLEMAPSFTVKIRLDGKAEAEYWYDLPNRETVYDTVVYDLTDEQFSEIKNKIDLKRLYNLDPECPDPNDVCDGGSSWIIIYDKNDVSLKNCGGFCPTNDDFQKMLRVLYENIPEQLKLDAEKYKKTWQYYAGFGYNRYGVFLGYEGALTDLSKEYDTIVIDAQYRTAEEISEFTKNYGKYVFSYINVGSLEDFRDYYDEYEDLGLSVYENWEDEVWINVADKRWHDFILNTLAPELVAKGIDGFFVDNCDVYYQYPTGEMLEGLSTIMEGLKDMGMIVIINGGDAFLDAYTNAGGNVKNVVDAINQESVISCIDWESETFGRNSDEDREYFEAYLEKYAAQGIMIYLLEYTDGSSIDWDIKSYCLAHGYGYYISHSLELD